MRKVNILKEARELPKKVWEKFKEISKVGGALLVAGTLLYGQPRIRPDDVKWVLTPPYPSWFEFRWKRPPLSYYQYYGDSVLTMDKTYWRWIRPAQWESIESRLEMPFQWKPFWDISHFKRFIFPNKTYPNSEVMDIFLRSYHKEPPRGELCIWDDYDRKCAYIAKIGLPGMVTNEEDIEKELRMLNERAAKDPKFVMGLIIIFKKETIHLDKYMRVSGITPGLSITPLRAKDTTIFIRKLGDVRARLYELEVAFDTTNPTPYALSPIGLFYTFGYDKLENSTRLYRGSKATLSLALYTGAIEACSNLEKVKMKEGSELVIEEYLGKACEEIGKDPKAHRRFTLGGYILVRKARGDYNEILGRRDIEAFNNMSYWDSTGIPYGWSKAGAGWLKPDEEAVFYVTNRNGSTVDTLSFYVIYDENGSKGLYLIMPLEDLF